MLPEPFEALLVIEIVPVTSPAAEGVNVKLKVALWLAAMVSGSAGALRENAGALDWAAEIVSDAVPLLLARTERLLLWPTTTLPKLSEAVSNPRVPV